MNTYQQQINPFLERRPYVYAIMWTQHNVAYVGVRFRKGCSPDDLWKSYFTSSRYVKEFRQKHGEPDYIEVLDVFLTPNEAVDAEAEIIELFALHQNPTFLNKASKGAIVQDADVRAKISAAKTGVARSKKDRPVMEKPDRSYRFSEGMRDSLIAKNKSRARKFAANGLNMTLQEWSEHLGFISRGQLANRLGNGWSFEKSISEPVRPRAKNNERLNMG